MKLLYLHTAHISSQMANLQQVVHMCNAFSNNGIEVVLSLFGCKDAQAIDNKKLVDQYGPVRFTINTRKIIISGLMDPYLLSSRIKRAIATEKPDLVFCRTHLYLKPCVDYGIPVVFESHTAGIHHRLRWLGRYWKKYVVKATLSQKPILMVAISEALKKHWVSLGVPSHKIISAHDGFDDSMFDSNISREKARATLNIKKTGFIVTYTGSLYKNRGIDNVLQLAAIFSSARFLVVGGPTKNKKEYEQLATNRGLKNIEFTGRVSHKDVPMYLYASDVLLGLWSSKVRTINYCSPLKIFEYMASGRVIIAQAFPTILEVLRHNHNALLAQPDNVADLRMKLKYCISNPAISKLGAKARQDAYENYSWDKRAKTIMQHFRVLFN